MLFPRILREHAVELNPAFAHLFQQSWDTGENPEQWSFANICPLFQKGNRDFCKQLSSCLINMYSLQVT